MNNEEKKLIETYREMKSISCKKLLISHAEAMVSAQEAIKADYGLDLATSINPQPAA